MKNKIQKQILKNQMIILQTILVIMPGINLTGDTKAMIESSKAKMSELIREKYAETDELLSRKK